MMRVVLSAKGTVGGEAPVASFVLHLIFAYMALVCISLTAF